MEKYKYLSSYVLATVICDLNTIFISRYINFKSRTVDQMDQAGRSGKQNIAEGYLQKSLEGRIKLLGVARGSLEELLNDYLDFLRQKGLKLWNQSSPEAQKVRNLAYKIYKDYNNYKQSFQPQSGYKIYIRSPEEAANAMVCLINQTNQLLDQKLRWTEEKFISFPGLKAQGFVW